MRCHRFLWGAQLLWAFVRDLSAQPPELNSECPAYPSSYTESKDLKFKKEV